LADQAGSLRRTMSMSPMTLMTVEKVFQAAKPLLFG
jgi:hypothetical protein